MPFYFNIWTHDIEDISTALSFYLIEVDHKYKFVASAWTTYILQSDPYTRIESFWRISRQQVLANIPELFPEYELMLMSHLPENNRDLAVTGNIYLSNNGSYIVRDWNGKRHEGELGAGIDLYNLLDRLSDPELKRLIVSVISQTAKTVFPHDEIRTIPFTQAEVQAMFGFDPVNTAADIFGSDKSKIYHWIDLLYANDVLIQQEAIEELNHLCTTLENRDAICMAGGISAVLSLFISEDVELKRQAILVLRNLSINPSNDDAIREAGGIEAVISLLASEDVDTTRYAIAALHNLSINVTNKDLIREAHGIPAVLALFTSKNVKTKLDAIMVVRSLSLNAINQDAIREAHGIAAVISLLSSEDVETTRLAISALLNLSIHSDNQDAIREAHGIAAVISLLSSEDVETTKLAISALLNLSSNATNHDVIREAHGIPILLSLLTSNNIETKRYATGALRNLSMNVTNQDAIREARGISAVLSLLTLEDIETKRHSIGVLRNLSFNDTNKDVIFEAGGISAILSLFTSKDVKTQRFAIGALRNFSVLNQDNIREAGGISAVFLLLTSEDVEIQKNAIITLNNLLFNNNKNKFDLCENNNDIATLLPFLSSLNSEIQFSAVSILLSLSIYNKDLFNSLDLTESLRPLLNSSDAKTKTYAEQLIIILQETNAPLPIIQKKYIVAAKKKLQNCGTLGLDLIAEIQCLDLGRLSTWSNLWKDACIKLFDILAAVNEHSNFADEEQLHQILLDQDSLLSFVLHAYPALKGDKFVLEQLDERVCKLSSVFGANKA